jgi:hypothetical protein
VSDTNGAFIPVAEAARRPPGKGVDTMKRMSGLIGLSGLIRVPGRHERGVYLAVIGVLVGSLLVVMNQNRRMRLELRSLAEQRAVERPNPVFRAKVMHERFESLQRAHLEVIMGPAQETVHPLVIRTFETDNPAGQEARD